jgi:hypothetical protein
MITKLFRLTLLAILAFASIGTSVAGSNFQQKLHLQRSPIQVLSFGVREPLLIKPVHNQSEDWLKDFSLEVKNISGRPIYFVEYALIIPQHRGDRTPASFRLTYGRNELVNYQQVAERNDTAIHPGETVSLKISEGAYRSFMHYMEAENNSIAPASEARLVIQSINFGDGTGWMGGKLRSQDIDKQLEEEAAQINSLDAARPRCNSYRIIFSTSAECRICGVFSTARIGFGNEILVFTTVFCLDSNAQLVYCSGFIIYPCS